ncbi:hypothetical protein BKA66DRAFT_529864 [Pyrenochaeta sp. MPI-SDFR-AT-0127]|nr:hypothetical protein BKA66DRAFT_529864 [Pyrenochaeta sp. MPI-SDFR-AT-0127]
MAPRGRSTIASEDVDRSYESSPDPLAFSTNENKAKALRKTAQKEPLSATSPSKQNRRFSVSDLDFSSPAKSMMLNTPRMGGASPWRIKVTVQAEPGSDENTESPSVKRVTRTKTTTVPLKDADTQSPVKRPRGRPRKSDVGAAAKPKRSGTPVKRAPRSKSRDTNVAAVGSSAADVDTDVSPKKKRGRPRKSLQLPIEDDETLVVEELKTSDATLETVTRPKATGSKKGTRSAASQPLTKALVEHELLVLDTPPRTEQGKKPRVRKGTPHAKKVVSVYVSSDEASGEDSDILTPTSGGEESEPQEAAQDSSAPQAPHENLPRSPMVSSVRSSEGEVGTRTATEDEGAELLYTQAFEDDENDDAQDITNFALDEGATRMPDDTTVLDSESFSMISVDSLPSNGGFSSPPKIEELQNANNPSIGSVLEHETSNPFTNSPSSTDHQMTDNPPGGSSHGSSDLLSTDATRSAPFPRYKTPAIDIEVPSAPPAMEPSHPIVPKTETPRIGRVVTAGVALQGVLDPSRLTPQYSHHMLDEKRNELEDLFRGFSEGTRRELQAGLRLGEQLAQGQSKGQSSPAQSSPIKVQPERFVKKSVFRTHRKDRQSRLLTPEEQDDHDIAPSTESAEANDVQYPVLNAVEVENPLLSPARSEDEMSWRVDTPPVTTTSHDHLPSVNNSQDSRDNVRETKLPVPADASDPLQHDDYSDIWQEEASRSPNSPAMEDPVEPKPSQLQLQDLFTDDGPIRPARGKLPRTWRRTSANNFQYSDEAEPPQEQLQAHAEVVELGFDQYVKGKARLVEAPTSGDDEVEDDESTSDASDDTGMFFQSNMPNVFNKQRSLERRQRKAEKQSLSSLLNESESLLPESSSPVAVKKSSSATKTNPFLDTPPHFPGYLSSPKKSSPLRREVRGSDISSDSPRRIEDESTLPLVQSSPFRTFVDGESALSTASDQRQFRVEMEGSTTSSIQRVRDEANEYLDAYEPQERSLNEITEVTEPSRTWHRDTTIIPSSPPQRNQSFAQSMLSPTRRPVPLFNNSQGSIQRPSLTTEITEGGKGEDSSSPAAQAPSNAAPAQQPQEPSTGLFSRLSSNLFEALSGPAAPAPHPILARFVHLPKIEPWTKTHYKTLDKLYTTHLKHPALFSSSLIPATPLSQTNMYLLNKFLSNNKKSYVGATFSAWGYSMLMSEELVVLCAVYMQLLSLADIDEYERVSGRDIQMGDCGPGRPGDVIKGEDVVNRLATVVLGEAVRRDEKVGKKVDKRGALSIEWPQ